MITRSLSKTNILNLPDEILFIIMNDYFPVFYKHELRTICKRFNNLISKPKSIKKILENKFSTVVNIIEYNTLIYDNFFIFLADFNNLYKINILTKKIQKNKEIKNN